MSRFSIVFAYAVPALLMMVVFAASYMLGDTGAVIFQKVIFAPVFLLATKGLRQYFPESLDSQRNVVTYAEFHIVDSALLSAFIVTVVSVGEADVMSLTIRFLVMTGVLSAIRIISLLYSRRKASRES